MLEFFYVFFGFLFDEIGLRSVVVLVAERIVYESTSEPAMFLSLTT